MAVLGVDAGSAFAIAEARLRVTHRGISVRGMDGRAHLGAGASASELIGRERECRALEELLDAVRVGQSRVLVARGDAGIGKSSLLQHLINAASDFHVVYATGVESEMELPFAALHQLCMSMLDRLDGLPDPQRDAACTAFGLTTGRTPDRLLIGLAVLNLLSAAADDRPLLCVIDDAQWLDRSSAQALTFVGRRLLADRVALVFATRTENPDLAEFPELVVQGLNDGDAQTLLSAVLRVPVDERVRVRIVAETHGNPLALVEWPLGLTPAELAGGFAMPARMPIAGQIEESYRRRIAELPQSTQQFLTVAAAEPTGDPMIVWRAASALGVDPIASAPAIESGLIEMGARVWFRHPLVRSAVYNGVPLTDRQAAHRALADATDPYVDPDRKAWHRALGTPIPDEDIAEALEHSADRARARGGLAAAAALLERSVALTIDGSRRGERILAAVATHLEAGSYEDAAGLLATAEATPLEDVQRAQVDLLRARHASVEGNPRHADVAGLMLRAAKRLESLDIDLAGLAYLFAMSAANVLGNQGNGAKMRDVAVSARTCPMPPARTMKDWLVIGLTQAAIEGPAAAAPALRRSLEDIPPEMPAAYAVMMPGWRNVAASMLWDIESFRKFSISSLVTARELGALTTLPTALFARAHIFALEGDLDAAAAVHSEVQHILAATGSGLSLFYSVVPLLVGLRGDAAAASALDDQIASARAAGLEDGLPSTLWGRAMLYNGTGQYEKSLDVASRANTHPWWGAHIFLAELIEAATRCGQSAVATATCEQLCESTQASGTEWALGIEARSRALLASDNAAEGLYREAIDRLGRTTLRPDLARAHLLYGEWLRRENRRVDARAELRTAHEMFSAMGIHGFSERTRHELLATGESVRKRTVESFDVLTQQEAHIARLAADGHTNPEIGTQLFISSRTVEWHLRKVFTKLNVTSRRELRAALRRQERLPEPA